MSAVFSRVSASRLLRASAWISGLQIVLKLQAVIVLAVAARSTSLSVLGAFVSAQAVSLLAAAVWDLGATSLVLRDSAMTRLAPAVLVRAVLRLRLYTFPVVAVALAATVYLEPAFQILGVESLTILVASSMVAAVHTVFNAALVGRGQYSDAVRISSISRTIVVVALLVLPTLHLGESQNIFYICSALFIGEMVVLAQQIVAYRRIRDDGDTDAQLRTVDVLRQVLPYFLNSLFNFAYNRLDQILAVLIAGTVVAGNYAPASQLQNVLALGASFLASGLISESRQAATSDQIVLRLHHRTVRLSAAGLAGAVVAVPLIIFFARPLLTILVGSPSQSAVDAARVIVFVLPFLAVQLPVSQALIAGGLVRVTSMAYAVGLGATVLAHVALDRAFGAPGAALASFIRDPVVVLALVYAYRNVLRKQTAELVGDDVLAHSGRHRSRRGRFSG